MEARSYSDVLAILSETNRLLKSLKSAKSKIKKGELANGEKVPTMTIIIKCTDEASYKNMVDALDEMTICSIGTYVIDKVNEDDLKLLEKRGIK